MKKNLRKILAGVVIVIVLAVIFMRGDQLEKLIETIQQGAPLFLVLAVISQLGKYASQGGAFVACFRAVNERLRFSEGIKLVFGTFFVNTVAPSMNLAGTALVVDDAARRNIPAGRATSAALLMQLTIDSGFVVIMAIAFLILSFTAGLQPGWLLLGLIAVCLVGGLAGVMVLGGTKPDFVLRILHPIEKLVDKIAAKFKKGPIDPWAKKTVDSFAQASTLLVKNPLKTARAFAFSILASTCELGCFTLTALAFGVHNPEACVCGYVVATLFAMISITPQGVGVVEAAALVAFSLFGIDQASGIAIIMVYRGIVFWLPFLIGAVLIQKTRAFQGAAAGTLIPEQTRNNHNGSHHKAPAASTDVEAKQPTPSTQTPPDTTGASHP